MQKEKPNINANMNCHAGLGAKSYLSIFLFFTALISFIFMFAAGPLTQMLVSGALDNWSPISRLDYLPSDDYYLFNQFTRFRNGDLPTWEIPRTFGHVVSMVMSFGVSDPILAILIYKINTGILYFIIPFFSMWYFTKNLCASFFAAVAFTFFPKLLTNFTQHQILLGELPAFFSNLIYHIKDLIDTTIYLAKPEYLSQSFRQPFPSLNFILTLLHVVLLVRLIEKPNIFLWFFSLIYTILMLFSYQPAALTSCVLVLAFFLTLLFERRTIPCVLVFAIGVFTLIFIHIFGYIDWTFSYLNDHVFVETIVGAVSPYPNLASHKTLVSLLHAIFNNYTLFFGLLFSFLPRRSIARTIITVMTLTIIVCKFMVDVELIPAIYGDRLFRRSLAPVILFVSIIGLYRIRFFEKVKSFDRIYRQRDRLGAAIKVCVFCVYISFITGFSNFGLFAYKHQLYTFGDGQRSVINWINQNAESGSIIITKSQVEMHYLSVFSNCTTFFISLLQAGKTPERVLPAFFASIKTLGEGRSYLSELINTAHIQVANYNESYLAYLDKKSELDAFLNFLNENLPSVEARLFFDNFIRPQQFSQIFGKPVLSTKRELEPTLAEKLLALFDKTPSALSQLAEKRNVYVLAKKDDPLSIQILHNCDIRFSSETYRLYSCS